jgi:alpha-L-fucosidase
MPGPPTENQIRRSGWWRAERFGMFIYSGLFSQHARQEWAMEKEAILVVEYQKLAAQFDLRPGIARE